MTDTTIPAKAFAAPGPTSPLGPYSFTRRAPRAQDIQIDVLYCGVCHSDLHQARDEWKAVNPTTYPCVPGHEIIGRVARVGGAVTSFKVGDLAGVGCMVDSCRACSACKAGLEQYCEQHPTYTYNSPDKVSGGVTRGGYSSAITVDAAFAVHVPASIDPARGAPLLCAGITTYSPLRHWKVGKGQTVGIVGLGGLGHMGVKFAHAMGAHTVLFTTSQSKVADGKRLGADEVVVTTDADELRKRRGTFDFILDTVSGDHNLNAYLGMLKLDGTMTLVGAPEKPAPVYAFALIGGRHRLAGSGIGGIAETQEMLDFCGKHEVAADIEVIKIQDINAAYERMLKGDVKYRFVIDMASL